MHPTQEFAGKGTTCLRSWIDPLGFLPWFKGRVTTTSIFKQHVTSTHLYFLPHPLASLNGCDRRTRSPMLSARFHVTLMDVLYERAPTATYSYCKSCMTLYILQHIVSNVTRRVLVDKVMHFFDHEHCLIVPPPPPQISPTPASSSLYLLSLM